MLEEASLLVSSRKSRIRLSEMKKIVALRGAGNRGKSTTLKIVYEYLLKSFSLLPEDRVAPGGRGMYRQDMRSDVRAIFVVNGKRVGIESQGDPKSRLKDSLDFFQRKRCDLIICATRTRGDTTDLVQALVPPYFVEWIAKSVALDEGSQRQCNRRDAETVMSSIRSL